MLTEQNSSPQDSAQSTRDSAQDREIDELRRRLGRRETLNLVSVVASAVVAMAALALSWKTAVDGSKSAVAAERLTARAVVAAEISAKAAQDAVRQNREASTNQLRLSTKQASEALNEMMRQNETARDAMRLEQRAWVGVVGYDAESPTAGHSFTVTAVFRNSGKTPARNVVVGMNIIPAPPDFRLPAKLSTEKALLTGAMDSGSRDLLLPDTTFSLSRTLDEASVAAYLTSKWRSTIYVWGRGSYDDVFMRRHWFTFCGKMAFRGEAFGPCEEGNDEDREFAPAQTHP